MRHRKSGRQLGRNSSHRKAMFRNMATSLLEHGRIKTTDAKAKELRRVVERLITLSKRVPPSAIEAASGQTVHGAVFVFCDPKEASEVWLDDLAGVMAEASQVMASVDSQSST